MTGSAGAAERPQRPDDRLAPIVATPKIDPERVRTCLSDGLASRLPGRRPAPMAPEAEVAARLQALSARSGRIRPPALLTALRRPGRREMSAGMAIGHRSAAATQ